uniref:Uncharacterized protein n=1 Tax=Quercus lobata TaxID=97700 RepID=A0A7N2R293_QUELO
MEIHQLFFYLVALSYFFASIEGLSRSDFPDGFVFGAGSSAYQELHTRMAKGLAYGILSLRHTQEDIALMKEIGLDSFRFSISWSRVLPSIQPCITLFHWDTPQALEDEYDGFLSIDIVNDYHDYAEFCFKEFGDRVKLWTTFNEPNTFSSEGYATGTIAPGRCSSYVGNCTFGNSGIEPYMVAHHILLSHATAVKLYREKYQASQMGEIGITISTFWMVPKYQTIASSKAASRALDFAFGWFAHPVTYGDYPKSMRALVGNRLPNFTVIQSKMVKGSLDFLGVNYYTARYADDSTSSSSVHLSYTTDSHVNLTRFSDVNNNSWTIQDALNDRLRLKYHQLHLSSRLKATRARINVKGYYVWSFLDDFEWESGYTYRFGINYIYYKNGLTRYMKHTAL